MARASLNAAITRPARDGNPMAAAIAGNATDDNSVTNTGKTMLLVRNVNGSATARTLTIHFAQTVLGQEVESIVKSIPAHATNAHLFGPYPTAQFGRLLLLDPEHADITFQIIQP